MTDTQTAVLKAAAGHPDGNIEPLPATLRGGARAKVIKGLLARGLMLMPMAATCLPMPATPSLASVAPARMVSKNGRS